MSKVLPLRRSEQLREQIEECIVTGAYPPGARLDEQELAASFGVPRTPVREALIQLASGGLIDLRPRRGASVPKNLSACRPPTEPAQRRTTPGAALRAHVVIQGERFTDLVATLRQFNAQDRPAGAATLRDAGPQPACAAGV